MKNENFINIQGWMIHKLNLKGNELILFALIYGFSQDEASKYSGSLSYISSGLSLSRRSVSNLLDRLIGKNFIIKIEDSKGNSFQQNHEFITSILNGSAKVAVVQKLHTSSAKVALISSAKVAHNNNNNNNINNANSKILFKNSNYNNYETLRDTLLKDKDFIKKYKGVNLREYIESVLLWSEGANSKNQMIKRTNRGWLSTLRQFMRSDLKKNVLIRIDEPKNLTMKKAHSEGRHINF